MVADELRESGGPVVEAVDFDRDAQFLLDRPGLKLEGQEPIAARDPELDRRDRADPLPECPTGRVQDAEQVRGTIREVPEARVEAEVGTTFRRVLTPSRNGGSIASLFNQPDMAIAAILRAGVR